MNILFHVSSDLMMASTVRIAAQQANLQYVNVPKFPGLDERIASCTDHWALAVDLQTPNIDLDALRDIVERNLVADDGDRSVWLYAQHVNEELLARARLIPGCSVMTRGQFYRQIAGLLQAS
ncbi:MAG: hypothetical protein R3C03_12960 [Pirellulaceae bacterium]